MSIFVILTVWIQLFNNKNAYIAFHTGVLISIESIILYIFLGIAERRKFNLLSIFLFNYIIFWNLRHATFSLWPKYPGILGQINEFGSEKYSLSVGICIVGLLFAVAGSMLAYELFGRKPTGNQFGKRSIEKASSLLYYSNYDGIIKILCIYSALNLAWSLYFNNYIGIYTNSKLLRYITLIFDGRYLLFALTFILYQGRVKYKHVGFILITLYAITVTLRGSRSGMIWIIISYIISGYNIKGDFVINYKMKKIIILSTLMPILFYAYIFGTIQRDLWRNYGLSINKHTVSYTLNKITELDAIDGFIGTAFGRAGYSHMSFEKMNNKSYEKVITFWNITKSIIENSLPGSHIRDAERISLKLGTARGNRVSAGSIDLYHSEAIGAIAENYILFGIGFFIIMFMVMLIFTTSYIYFNNDNIMSIFIKFIIIMTMFDWMNSFGYDWTILENLRRIIIGGGLVFFLNRQKRLTKSMIYKSVRIEEITPLHGSHIE